MHSRLFYVTSPIMRLKPLNTTCLCQLHQYNLTMKYTERHDFLTTPIYASSSQNPTAKNLKIVKRMGVSKLHPVGDLNTLTPSKDLTIIFL